MKPLLSLEAVQQLYSWGGLQVATSQPSLSAQARSAIAGIDSVAPIMAPHRALTDAASGGFAGAIVAATPSHMEGVDSSLQALLQRHTESDGNGDKFVDAMALSFSGGALEVLEREGVVELQNGEFGDLRVAVRPASLVFSNQFSCDVSPVGVFQVPLLVDFRPFAHKLGLVVDLVRRGWADAYKVEEHIPGDKSMLTQMTLRSRLYFLCLLMSEELYSSGLHSILTMRPESYYKCLLCPDALGRLLEYPPEDIIQMQGKHFIAIAKGILVPPLSGAMLALADGALEEEVADMDPGDTGDEEQEPHEATALDEEEPGLAEALVGLVLAGFDMARESDPIDIMGYRIKFDFWSHSSGHQRA